MANQPSISPEEYKALSDQKAQDWRAISEVNPTLFGVAGAIFAAGVAQSNAFVVALAPVPLFIGVWHMTRHARLQLQMITYLAVFAPAGMSWERDVAAVRPLFWERARSKGPRFLRANDGLQPEWLARLLRPSAWYTWLAISLVIALVATIIPPISGYSSAGYAVLLGAGIAAVASGIVIRQARQVEPDREVWTKLWEEHRSPSEGRP
jgi:hypothetical protein